MARHSSRTNSPFLSAPTHEKNTNPSSDSGPINVDAVRERAYQLYEMRVASHSEGDPISDWLQAERQVREEGARSSSPIIG